MPTFPLLKAETGTLLFAAHCYEAATELLAADLQTLLTSEEDMRRVGITTNCKRKTHTKTGFNSVSKLFQEQ